jgi:hypothetical protein
MKYVEKSLTEGEQIIHTTHRHWIVLFGPVAGALVLAVPGIALLFEKDMILLKKPEERARKAGLLLLFYSG